MDLIPVKRGGAGQVGSSKRVARSYVLMHPIDNKGVTDPRTNLALEEYCLRHLDPANEYLLFYINAPSVILGKHQIPYLESEEKYKTWDWTFGRSPPFTVGHKFKLNTIDVYARIGLTNGIISDIKIVEEHYYSSAILKKVKHLIS